MVHFGSGAGLNGKSSALIILQFGIGAKPGDEPKGMAAGRVNEGPCPVGQDDERGCRHLPGSGATDASRSRPLVGLPVSATGGNAYAS